MGFARELQRQWSLTSCRCRMLVLKVKGQDTQQNRTKRGFLDEWVRAVNAHGGFGSWVWDVSFDAGDVPALLAEHVTI